MNKVFSFLLVVLIQSVCFSQQRDALDLATEMYSEYSKNIVRGDQLYKNKSFIIKGVLTEIGKFDNSKYYFNISLGIPYKNFQFLCLKNEILKLNIYDTILVKATFNNLYEVVNVTTFEFKNSVIIETKKRDLEAEKQNEKFKMLEEDRFYDSIERADSVYNQDLFIEKIKKVNLEKEVRIANLNLIKQKLDSLYQNSSYNLYDNLYKTYETEYNRLINLDKSTTYYFLYSKTDSLRQILKSNINSKKIICSISDNGGIINNKLIEPKEKHYKGYVNAKNFIKKECKCPEYIVNTDDIEFLIKQEKMIMRLNKLCIKFIDYYFAKNSEKLNLLTKTINEEIIREFLEEQ